MKQLLLLLLSLTLFNCSNDDDNTPDDLIEGEWIGYKHFQIEDN